MGVRLLRQVHKRAIFILEGETDARVFDRFIDGDLCVIEISFGKENLVEALDLLEDEGFPGVVALADADFDRLNGTKYRLENLCLTDQHDLDLTIFASSAFDRCIGQTHGPMHVAGADRDLGMAFGSCESNIAVPDKLANAIRLRHTNFAR